jgi:1,2-dihydroxy-3-keto-5-methylthiopentene dioxygenase
MHTLTHRTFNTHNQPDPLDTVTIEAWLMAEPPPAGTDQREPQGRSPNEPVSAAALRDLGVLVWKVPPGTPEGEARLAAIKEARGYSYSVRRRRPDTVWSVCVRAWGARPGFTSPSFFFFRPLPRLPQDIINVSPATLPGYDTKIKAFYEEHIHTDEEIRYVRDGSGYFDVRDREDRWVRIHTRPGDLIVLPEGIFHRFTLDTDNHITAERLFVGVPVWTPHNRGGVEAGADATALPSRRKYVEAFLGGKEVSPQGVAASA